MFIEFHWNLRTYLACPRVRFLVLHCATWHSLSFKSNCQHTCSYSHVQFYFHSGFWLALRHLNLWKCLLLCAFGFTRSSPVHTPILGPLHSGIRMHTDVPDPVPQNNVFVRTSTLPLLWWNVAFSCTFKIMHAESPCRKQSAHNIYTLATEETSASFSPRVAPEHSRRMRERARLQNACWTQEAKQRNLRPWLLNWIEHGLIFFWRTMCIRRCCNRQHLDSNKYCGTLRNRSRYNPTHTHQTCFSSGGTPHLQVQLSFSQTKIAYTCA